MPQHRLGYGEAAEENLERGPRYADREQSRRQCNQQVHERSFLGVNPIYRDA